MITILFTILLMQFIVLGYVGYWIQKAITDFERSYMLTHQCEYEYLMNGGCTYERS